MIAPEWRLDQGCNNHIQVARAAIHLKHAIACETLLHATLPGGEAEGQARVVLLIRHLENMLDAEKAYNGSAYAHLNTTSQELLEWLGRAQPPLVAK